MPPPAASVDLSSSPPTIPVQVPTGPKRPSKEIADFSEKGSAKMDSYRESEGTSASESTPSSSPHSGAASLHSSLSDLASIAPSVEPSSLSLSELNTHLGLVTSESATPTIASTSIRTSALSAAVNASMPPHSPTSSTSDGAHAPASPPDNAPLDSSDTKPAHDPLTFPSLEPQEGIPVYVRQLFVVLKAEVLDMRKELRFLKEAVKTTVKDLEDTQAELQTERSARAEDQATHEKERLTDREEFEKLMSKHQEQFQSQIAKAQAERDLEKAEWTREKEQERQERAREREEARQERAQERAKDRDKFEKKREKDQESRKKDRDIFNKNRKKQQGVIDYLLQGMQTLTTWASSQDGTAMGAINSRIVSDDVAKFLCIYFNLPDTYPDYTNATAVFRQWLESGAESLAKTGEQGSEDHLRKKYFQQQLLDRLAPGHTIPKVASTPAQLQSSPVLLALSYLYHSSEALDALTQRRHILREDGNFATHNLVSLERYSVQLEEGNSHLKDEALQAMKVLVQVCKCVADRIPKESLPVGSTLGTLASIATPTLTRTALPSSHASHPVSTKPPSTSHPAPTSPASESPASGPSSALPKESESHSEPKPPASTPRSKGSGSGKKSRSNKGKR